MNFRKVFLSGISLLVVFLFAAFGQLTMGTAIAHAAEVSAASSLPAKTRAAVLKVEGLSCASCVGQVKHTLKQVNGVTEVDVSLQNREARVQYDPAKVSPEALAAAVNNLGYKATLTK